MKTTTDESREKDWHKDRPGHHGEHDSLGVHPERAEAEAQSLQDAYNAPSAEEPNYDSLSPEKLDQSEKSPKPTEATSPEKSEQDSLSEPSFFKDTDSSGGKAKFLGRFSRRQKIIGGGATAGIVGGAIALFSISNGPLQFIHMAQLLRQFHFASVEEAGDDRVLKLYKWSKFARNGTLENARLGVAGNRIAQRIEPKMTAIGIEKRYSSGLTARYDGTIIDKAKFIENASSGEQFRGLNDEQFKTKFKEVFKVDLEIDGPGKLKSSAENGFFAYFRNRSLNGIITQQSGLKSISGSVSARVLTKRDGVILHPIRRADAAIVGSVDDRFSSWLERQKQRINRGEGTTVKANGTEEKKAGTDEPDPDRTASNVQAADDLNDIVDDVKANGGDAARSSGVIRQILGSRTGRVTIGATAVVGLLCAAKSIGDEADALKHDMVVLPLIRTGMMGIGLGNQVMNGKDVDMEQLGFYSKQLYDKDEGSWSNARSIQHELGEPLTGPDIPEEASIKKASEGNMFTDFVSGIPGIGVACSALSSGIGKAFSFAISLTTPIATGATMAILSTPAAKNALSGLVRWLAGSPIAPVVAGPRFGNYANHGARLAAGKTFANMGGTPLSTAQSLELKNHRQADNQQQFAARSFKQKYFDVHSPDSFIAKVIDQQSPQVGQNVSSFVGSLLSPSKFFGSIKLPFATASAATDYDYGFAEFGFPLSDLNSQEFDNPYANGEAVLGLLKGPSGDRYIDKAHACFGVNLTKEGGIQSDFSYQLDIYRKEGGDYPKNCGEASPDGLADWKKVRFYILDSMTAAAADCYETTDRESCETVGMGASSDTSTGGSEVTNSNIYFLGDSLTKGMETTGGLRDKLRANGWSTITIQSYCGRHLNGRNDRCGSEAAAPHDGLAQIDQPSDTQAIQSANTVVMALGTNDWQSSSFENDVATMINSIKQKNASAKIYWVNLFSTDGRAGSFPPMNQVLQAAANEGKISIIDWASVAAPHYQTGDGLHPSDYGAMAQFVTGPLKPESGGKIVGDIGESSESVPCAAGTRDLGVVLSKYSGNATRTPGQVRLRLCQLTEIGGRGENTSGSLVEGGAVVSSRVAGAWNELGKKAKADGVDLVASSSFRLNDSCNGTGDGSGCARPGKSLHQLGIAIDFKNQTDVWGTSTDSCVGRARDPGNKYWEWLFNNAENFGFKQYAFESWHWDALNSESRCGRNQ